MLTIFILCAGNGDRWNGYLGVPKQLITFGGEALIERTARVVIEQKLGHVCCVSRDSSISLSQHDSLFVSHTDSLTETIMATRRYWSDRNVFLLGDVFYSKHALSLILDCQRALTFLGRPWPSSFVKCGHGEMFGLTVSSGATDDFYNLLTRGLSITLTGAKGNLWNLYQLAGNLPLGSSQYLPHLLLPVDDYTNDIDTPIDYLRRKWLYETISSKGERDISLMLRSLALLPKHYLEILRWRRLNSHT